MATWDAFEKAYAQQCEALRDDPNITDAERSEFRAHIADWDGKGDVITCAKQFCYARQLRGPEIILDDAENLGHLHRTNEFQILIEEALAISSVEADALIKDWMTLSDSEQIAEVVMTVGTQVMGRHLMWSFRNPGAANPFHALDLTDLPCRLGLDEGAYETYYRWAVRMPLGRAPTAFDAAMDARWTPGGVTNPCADCSAKYPAGLPEIVHRPPNFSALAGAVRAAP